MKLKIPESIQYLIRHLPPDTKAKVRNALDSVRQDPRAGKFLVNELEGYQSYVFGKLRIVYRLAGGLVEVVAIGPRKNVYKLLALELIRKTKHP
jgi:mRNA-degrading endonuclease RelE of RelBE toxin-antitoxin system